MATYTTKQKFGTAQTVINSATDIASGNFGGAPAATFDNTTDADVPYATHALCMIEMPDWAAAPVAQTQVEIWGVLKDTDGTDDDTDAPSGTAINGGRYFGAATIAASDTLQRRTVVIDITGVKFVDFYLRNGTAQNLNNDGGTSLIMKVTPFSVGMDI